MPNRIINAAFTVRIIGHSRAVRSIHLPYSLLFFVPLQLNKSKSLKRIMFLCSPYCPNSIYLYLTLYYFNLTNSYIFLTNKCFSPILFAFYGKGIGLVLDVLVLEYPCAIACSTSAGLSKFSFRFPCYQLFHGWATF